MMYLCVPIGALFPTWGYKFSPLTFKWFTPVSYTHLDVYKRQADACWASFMAVRSQPRSATRKAGRPDCREPKKSPGPRRRRSSSAILKPSAVLHRAFSRWSVSGLRLWVVRMQ